MEVMDQNASRDRNRSSLMMLIGGSILVTGLIAISVVIS
jgi:predicted nucleic acid-binding Zn ribbon protein